ncbi:MAG: hypothetical protein AAGA68_24465 [Pseudomonadota bacterium]
MNNPALIIVAMALGIAITARPFAAEIVDYREIIRDAPVAAISDVQAEEYGVPASARWRRLVNVDIELFLDEPDGVQRLFSPLPDLTYFLRHRGHEDYGPATAWNGEMVDASGATVGYISVIASSEGYLRLQANDVERTFMVVSIPDRAIQVLYER